MHRNRATLIAVLVLFTAVTDAETSEPRYTILDDPTAYGLAAGQGIAHAQVVLARRDIAGSAGEIVAKAISGAGGGVTFENVPPGQYVMTISVAHVVPQQVAPVQGDIPLASNLFPYRRVKNFFESRANVVPMTISGQEWRSFAIVPYVYAVRAVSLSNEAVEVRTDQYSTVIAQQFVVPDGNPAAVQAAIGYKENC